MKYQLTKLEIENVQNMVRLKFDESRQKGFKHKWVGEQTFTDAPTLTGFAAEQAWASMHGAKYSFRPYNKTNDDVLGYQIRATRHQNGCLLTHDDDNDGYYLFATVSLDFMVTFKGWQELRYCNLPYAWASDMPHPCYKTSTDRLIPMDMLPATDALIQHRRAMVA